MFLREVVSGMGPVLFSFFIIDVGQVMECLFHLTSAGETRLSVDYQVIQQWQDCRCKLKWGLSGYREKFFPHEDSQAVNTAHRNCTVSTFGRFPSSNWSCSWAVWSYPLAGLALSSRLDERHAEVLSSLMYLVICPVLKCNFRQVRKKSVKRVIIIQNCRQVIKIPLSMTQGLHRYFIFTAFICCGLNFLLFYACLV